MGKLGILIFVAGILLSVCAFIADKVDHIPAVLRVLAPAYVRAQAGIDKLETTKTLEPADEAFAEISKLFFNKAARENPPELLATLSIRKLTAQTAMMAFGKKHVGELFRLRLNFRMDRRSIGT